jgi:translation elongation factor EF-Ts
MEKIVYNSKYGHLEFELVENYHKVGEISSKNYDKDLFFSIEVAEQIALITENHNIQCGAVFPEGMKFSDISQMYLIHHQSGSMGAVCKITNLEFTSEVTPMKEIEYLAKVNKGKELAWINGMVYGNMWGS